MQTVGLIALFLFTSILSAQQFSQGTLRRVDRQGQALADCPLKRTSVQADIGGMLARVTVTQEFQNPFTDTIEAVYVFPLPHEASVDRMTMTVGGRTIKGKIKPREEAQAMYNAARQAGQTAGLLDQERPNIFTQSVANIVPGGNVIIVISYVEVMKYESGKYEFVFPMVVGPRYIRANRVPDASRITPPVAAQGTRPGHDVAIALNVDAGMPIGIVESPTHDIDVQRTGATQMIVRLRDEAVIPNKDFILRYDAAGRTIESAVLAHRAGKDGFFTLIVQPPQAALASDVTPKELIFVLDTSGSMYGFPIDKAKETMKLALNALHSRDTFNLITFSGDTEILFPQPVPGSAENIKMAQLFLESRSGGGGTEMMKAIRAALDPSGESGRVRVVCFMTDGYVGNDMEIIAEVQKHPEARVFAFGIGSSVNRFLLDRMAMEGRGEVEYVGLQDDGAAAARRFEQRLRDPLLTDITIDWAGLPVIDVYPKRIPDLFSAKPIVVTGRYTGPANGTVRVRGKSGGPEMVRDVSVNLPASQATHDSLATLWARQRVADLMSHDYAGLQTGTVQPKVKTEITQLGINYGIMTQFTSFIAVEERSVTTGGHTRVVDVPVAMPEGVRHQAVLGSGLARGLVGGVPGGTAGGVLGGIIGSVPSAAAPPPPPPQMFIAPGHPVTPKSVRISADPSGSGALAKLDSALQTLASTPNLSRTVNIQVLLRDASPAFIEELKKIGLVILTVPGRNLQLRGRISSDKLLALTQHSAVRYIVAVGK